MAHGNPEGISIDGIAFDLDPECDIDVKPPLRIEKKATTGPNTTKAIKQVPQISGAVVQFENEKKKDLLYSLISTEDMEIIITFAGNLKLYITGTFMIESSSSQEGSCNIIIDPSVPSVWG